MSDVLRQNEVITNIFNQSFLPEEMALRNDFNELMNVAYKKGCYSWECEEYGSYHERRRNLKNCCDEWAVIINEANYLYGDLHFKNGTELYTYFENMLNVVLDNQDMFERFYK